ncbi:hypothetical protein PG991_000136 [Apiospora marii]|uniref:F-box domain-containing protein n=1 Tax=Apiospora marii TaxID=335849 RepID=A0ABR1T1A5_9PEZI
MADTATNDVRAGQMRQRLLLDIDELIRKPYPNIRLHVGDNMDQLCLVLSPPGWQRMHLVVDSLQEFPMHPPRIQMDTPVNHPNVFGAYICATILNRDDSYTPAYTLKGIAIQLLSFFGSDTIQQDYGEVVDLNQYRTGSQATHLAPFASCERCGFEEKVLKKDARGVRYRDQSGTPQVLRERPVTQIVASDNLWSPIETAAQELPETPVQDVASPETSGGSFAINSLPNEILLLVLESLEDFEDLTNLAKAWPRVSALITAHNVIRQRELQCFVTKKTYRDAKLGVGVSTTDGLSSEFDLLSQEAFALPTRKSVQCIPFTRWLPLPISTPHWNSVRQNVKVSLSLLKEHVKLPNPTHAQVLYAFMNDIVVKLNLVNLDNVNVNGKEKQQQQQELVIRLDDMFLYDRSSQKSSSTLTHASEKAIESYFHLFHLLVCLATESPAIVTQANALLTSFLGGQRDKSHCPNLGHLLVAMLVSDIPVTDQLRRAIITEAITRNVVWLLNPNNESRGRRHNNGRDRNSNSNGNGNAKKTYPELAYLEPDAISAYRLDKTFQGSRTSYRLLMFSELFRRTARPSTPSTSPPSSLAQIRDDLFRRHGAPPPGAAAHLASEVRRLHAINDFPAFLREMGFVQIPSPAQFTAVLRNTVVDSMGRGYSRWALAQSDALALRMREGCEPGVGVKDEFAEMVGEAPYLPRVDLSGVSFFPGGNNRGGRGGGGGVVIGNRMPRGVAWPRRGGAAAAAMPVVRYQELAEAEEVGRLLEADGGSRRHSKAVFV